MTQSPSASSMNAGATTTQYPKKLQLSLSLEVEVQTAEFEQYLADSAGNLQMGFIADLYDLLNFQQELGVTLINGVSFADVQRYNQKFIP